MFTMQRHQNGESPQQQLQNGALETAIAKFQVEHDPQSLEEIVNLARNRTVALIRFYRTDRYRSEDELISDVNFKLIRSVAKFDPAKGSAFTFVSHVIATSLCTSVTNARKHSARHCELDDEYVHGLYARSHDHAGLDDLEHRVKNGARTSLIEPSELSAQRWYIESFCHEGFEARRHVCANAAMAVHSLSHGRSRELYDLTMLEVRRVLYDSLRQRQPIVSGRLLGTRCAWMTRYRPLLSKTEFSKFAVLMRDLAPYVVLLITNPNHANNRRADRAPTIGRRNLELILYGCPDAVALFNLSNGASEH